MSTQSIQSFSTGFKMRSDLHVLRKLWHIFSGSFGLYIYRHFSIDSHSMAYFLILLGLCSTVVELLRLKNQKMNTVLMKFMGPLMRESEKNSMSGMPYYALGIGFSLYFYSEQIAILATLFLIFADPLASFFGILYGRDKILPNKSLQGSIAAYSVCYLLTIILGLIYVGPSMNLLGFALIAGFIGCLSELCAFILDDNLIIPVVSGAGLTLLNYFLCVFK